MRCTLREIDVFERDANRKYGEGRLTNTNSNESFSKFVNDSQIPAAENISIDRKLTVLRITRN